MTWTDAEAREYLRLRLRLEQLKRQSIDYRQYANDAEGFIENVLGGHLTDDLRAICRSVVEYPVTFAKSGNGTGKSWIIAQLVMWFFMCQKSPQVYCSAAVPVDNLTNNLWSKISGIYNTHPGIFSGLRKTHLRIERNPEEFIVGVTIPQSASPDEIMGRFSGKHAPSLFIVFDEGDLIPDAVHAGADTCLSGEFGRRLVAYNPRFRKGRIYRDFRDGKANIVHLTAFNHPNVITGENVIDGAVSRSQTTLRIAQMTRPLAEGEERDKRCFELPGYLVGCSPIDQTKRELPALVPGWYRITTPAFSHMVLGEYPSQADDQLISEEWTDKARSRYDLFTAKHGVIIPETIRCIGGVDIADGGEDSSVFCKRFGNLVHPLVAWEKQDVIEVGDLVQADTLVNGIKNIGAIYCDGTGVGAGTAPYMVKQYQAPAVKVMVANAPTEESELGAFGLLLDQLMWQLREWLRKDLAMLPPDPDLIEELLAFSYEIKGGKVKVSSTDDVKSLLGRSPDRARALMLTFMRSGWFSEMDLS